MRASSNAGAYRGFQFIDGANGGRDGTRRRYYGGTAAFYPLAQVTQ